MHWLLQSASHYATPEVFTVAGTMLAAFTAWKAASWLVRSIVALMRLLPVGLLSLAITFVSGATTAGWGMARWIEWGHAPASEIAGLSAYEQRVLQIIGSTYDPNRLRTTMEFVQATAASHADDPVSMPTFTEVPPQPSLGPGLAAFFGGIATCVAVFACVIGAPPRRLP